MAKTSQIERAKRTQKYTSRIKNRCVRCGRSRGYMRRFGFCRLCFREYAHKGYIPGVVKASW